MPVSQPNSARRALSFGVGRARRSTSRRLGLSPIDADSSVPTEASFSHRWNARCKLDDRLVRPNWPERIIWNSVRSTRPLSTTRSNTLCISCESRFDRTANSAAGMSFMNARSRA